MLELTLIGNLGKDPEAHYTENGTLVCHFAVAATRRSGSKEETTWVEVTAWDKLAETCHQYLSKGSRVLVRGYPEVRLFTRKNGEAGASLKVTAQMVEFLGGKPQGGAKAEEAEEVPC